MASFLKRTANASFVPRLLSIGPSMSLALIGSASAKVAGEQEKARAEALSIRRLEGSRWQGGRIWSYKLVWSSRSEPMTAG